MLCLCTTVGSAMNVLPFAYCVELCDVSCIICNELDSEKNTCKRSMKQLRSQLQLTIVVIVFWIY
jgi:hypothetical protein